MAREDLLYILNKLYVHTDESELDIDSEDFKEFYYLIKEIIEDM